MKLFEEVKEETGAMNTLGVVKTLIQGGEIQLNSNNLVGTKLIMVDLVRKDGAKQRAYCSVALTNHIRKSKMKLQELINFIGSLSLALTTNEEGEQRLKIIMDQGATLSGKVTGEPEKKALVLEEIPW